MNNGEQEPVFYITANVLGFKRIGFMRIQSLIEGSVYAYLVYRLIGLIPFVKKVKLIVTACLCVVVVALTIAGYRNQTPMEIIYHTIKEKKMDHEYHMRSINDEEGKDYFGDTNYTNESIADKIVKKVKEYRNRED